MLAIDTNVIVRYLTSDHPEQSPQARALIDIDDVFVCTTVLLETEWVLRAAYGYPSAQVGAAFRAFAGLSRVTLEDPALVATALEWDSARNGLRGRSPFGESRGLRSLCQLRQAACQGSQGAQPS